MAVTRLTVRAPSEIRNSFLRTMRVGLLDLGVPDPNVSRGSETYVLGEAIANELAVVEANAIFKADASMPDTAQDDDLLELASSYGVEQREAVGSIGPIVFDSSASSSVSSGAQLIDPSGNSYEVVTAGTYDDGDLITIQALVTGEDSNLAEGTVLRWVSPPAFSAQFAAVGPGGLRFGYDAESLEDVRATLLGRLQDPPAGGNPANVALTAEKSYASVQKAFVYPAIYGPGSTHVAVTARTTKTNKNRDLDAGIVTGYVTPAVNAAFADQGDTTFTTVTNETANICLDITIPLAPTAPGGTGGGWLDAQPWPIPHLSGIAQGRASVVSVGTSSAVIASSTAPVAGSSRCAWVNTTTWEIEVATVLSYVIDSGTAPTALYDVTFDRPVPNLSAGMFVFPQCVSQDTYLAAVLEAFARLGPGEKTSNASVLVRGYRRPSVSWPKNIDSAFLAKVQDSGDEITLATLRYSSQSSPTVPAGVTDPPNILVPNFIAFYPST